MPRRIRDLARWTLKKKDNINVSVKESVWRELKQISTDHRITLGEAVELALNKAREAQKYEDQRTTTSTPDKSAKNGDE